MSLTMRPSSVQANRVPNEAAGAAREPGTTRRNERALDQIIMRSLLPNA
jgi:hypothetical protein